MGPMKWGKQGVHSKSRRCSRRTFLCVTFVLALVVFLIEVVVIMSRPGPLPTAPVPLVSNHTIPEKMGEDNRTNSLSKSSSQGTELIVPSTVLFQKIHTPKTNLPCFLNLYTSNAFVRQARFPDRLDELRKMISDTITKIRRLDRPLFPHEPNTTGIVMTCKLCPMCLANLHHLFDNMKVSLPVGLSSSSLSESVVLFHGMALMNRIVVETITNKKRRSAYVGKNIPW